MPYRQVYEPAPKNMKLPVLTDEQLPQGVVPRAVLLGGVREAYGVVGDDFKTYHYCSHCKGWIEGSANAFPVHNLGMLSGRSGQEYYCLRCGHEIAFIGMMG